MRVSIFRYYYNSINPGWPRKGFKRTGHPSGLAVPSMDA